MYGVHGDNLSRQYKRHISGVGEWEWRNVAEAYVLFEKNLGPRLSIDETCLSQDEVYTVVTNKDAHGRKGSMDNREDLAFLGSVEGKKAITGLHVEGISNYIK